MQTKRWDNGGSQTLSGLALKNASFLAARGQAEESLSRPPGQERACGEIYLAAIDASASQALPPEPFRAETGADQI